MVRTYSSDDVITDGTFGTYMTKGFRCKFVVFQNEFEDDEEAFELRETFAEDFSIFTVFLLAEKRYFSCSFLFSGLEN